MIKRKYHALASIAAFVSVILLSCLVLVFGLPVLLIMIVYRLIVPYRQLSEREKMDEEWQLKHHGFIVSRN